MFQVYCALMRKTKVCPRGTNIRVGKVIRYILWMRVSALKKTEQGRWRELQVVVLSI